MLKKQRPIQLTFSSVMAGILMLASLGLLFAALFRFSEISVVPGRQDSWIVLFGLLFCFLLVLLIRLCFLAIDAVKSDSRQKLLAFGLFLLMAGVFAVVLRSMEIRPMTDSFDDIDTACSLLSGSVIGPDHFHIVNLSRYGNNYFYILFLTGFFRLLRFLHISDILTALDALNAVSVLLSGLLAWLLSRGCFGIRHANKFLVLFALNPVYYGLAFWDYTLTLSLPVMMAILWLAFLFRRTGSLWKKLLLAVLEAVLVVLGYELRPTAVFPFLAMLFALPAVFRRSGSKRHFLYPAAVFLLVLVCCHQGVTSMKDAHFETLYDSNYPLGFWLMMGSHGNGDLSTDGEDLLFIRSLDPNSDKNALCMQKAVDNYRRQSLPQVLRLWTNKIGKTWTDGYSGIYLRLRAGLHEGAVYDLLTGKYSALYRVFAIAFRALTFFSVFVYCLSLLRTERIRPVHLVLILCILGALLFYMLWEAKNIYSAAFLPVLLLMSEQGLSRFFRLEVPRISRTPFTRIVAVVLLGMLLLPVFGLCDSAAANTYFQEIRINALCDVRLTKSLSLTEEAETISQSFYTAKPFNQLILAVDTESSDKAECEISIRDSAGQLLVSSLLDASQIRDRRIQLDFDPVHEDTNYTLTISRTGPSSDHFRFFTKNSYYLDSYPGELTASDGKQEVNDLLMNVQYAYHGFLLSPKQSAVLASSFCLLMVLLLIVSYRSISKEKEPLPHE